MRRTTNTTPTTTTSNAEARWRGYRADAHGAALYRRAFLERKESRKPKKKKVEFFSVSDFPFSVAV
jgi:hypothetical protein